MHWSDDVDIADALRSYEEWLRRQIVVIESALRIKHAEMREDLYAFLRGTFFRWAQLYPVWLPDEKHAPRVLAVGDLHVGSFGTWRDAEGRLSWGVDDFDDAYPLPYTNDLIRLATSARIVRDIGYIDVKSADACEVILDAYETTLREGGCPMVFAEEHEHLEKLGIDVIKPPPDFWQKLRRLPVAQHVPRSARRALEALLPDGIGRGKIVRRQAGLGSLGQPRFALIAACNGGDIAREVKSLIPSSCVWASGRANRAQPYYQRAMSQAVRSRDPFQKTIDGWIVRRLSPDSNPIEISSLRGKRDEMRLLHAMGAETANIHLGTPARTKAILRDIHRRDGKWLRDAAKTMAKVLEREWREYKST